MSREPKLHHVVLNDGCELDITNIGVGIAFEERSRQPEESSSGSLASSSNPESSPPGSFAPNPSVYPHTSEIPSCLDVDEIFGKLKVSTRPGQGRLANPKLAPLTMKTERTFETRKSDLPSRRQSMSDVNNRYGPYNPRYESNHYDRGERGTWSERRARSGPRRGSLITYDEFIAGPLMNSGSIPNPRREYNDTDEYDRDMTMSIRSNSFSRRKSWHPREIYVRQEDAILPRQIIRNHSSSRREYLSNRYDSYNTRQESFSFARGEQRPSSDSRHGSFREEDDFTGETTRGSTRFSARSGGSLRARPEDMDTSEYGRRMKLSSRSSHGSRRGSLSHETFGMERTNWDVDHYQEDAYVRQEDSIRRHHGAYHRMEEFRHHMRSSTSLHSEDDSTIESIESSKYNESLLKKAPRRASASQGYPRREDSFQIGRAELRKSHSMMYPVEVEDFERYARDEYRSRHEYHRMKVADERSQRSYYDDRGESDDNEKAERQMVEVTPGNFVPLRGSAETLEAVHLGRIQHTTCFVCKLSLVCVEDAEMVICPTCKTISPLEGGASGRGLGLGLKEALANSEINGERRD